MAYGSNPESGITELRTLDRKGQIKLASPSTMTGKGRIAVTSASSPMSNLRAVEPVDLVWQSMHLQRPEQKWVVYIGEGGNIKSALEPELATAEIIGLNTERFLSGLSTQVRSATLEKYADVHKIIKADSVPDRLLLPASHFSAPKPELGVFIEDPKARKLFQETAESLPDDSTFVDFSAKLRQEATALLARAAGIPEPENQVVLLGDIVDPNLKYRKFASSIGDKKAIVSFHCLDCGHMSHGETVKHFTLADGTVGREGGKEMKCRHARAVRTDIRNNPSLTVRAMLEDGAFLPGLSCYLFLLQDIREGDVVQLRDYSQGRGTYTRVFGDVPRVMEVLATRRLYLGKAEEEKAGNFSTLALPQVLERYNFLADLEYISPFIEPNERGNSQSVITI